MIKGKSIPDYLLAGFSLLIVCAGIFYSFNSFVLFDDAYMFTRYADHMIGFGEYSWNLGDGNVYGTTSVAYTFTLIPFRWLFSGDPSLPLVISSLFWGILFIYLSFRLVKPAILMQGKRMIVVAWVVCIAWCMQSLMIHFGSGMETTFVMSFSCIWLLLFRKSLREEKIRLSVLTAVLGGIAWWVRPDLMVFTLGIPATLLLWKQYRIRAFIFCLITAASLAIILEINYQVLGSMIPLPFLAKSSGLYGAEIRKLYSKIPWTELLRFALFTLPVWVVLIFGSRNIRLKKSPLLVSVMICVYLFLVYYVFFVLQIMGYGQRFYFPVLPFVFFAIAEAFRSEMDEKANEHFQKPLTVWILAAVLILPALRIVKNLEKHSSLSRFSVFNSERVWKESKRDYWIGLGKISKYPNDLVIASTEVGLPAALNPDKKIIDLSGLNDEDLLLHHLDPDYMARRYQPDILYFPHADYVRLLGGYYNSEYIMMNYKIRLCQEGKCVMDIAIRKKCRFFPEMDKILAEEFHEKKSIR